MVILVLVIWGERFIQTHMVSLSSAWRFPYDDDQETIVHDVMFGEELDISSYCVEEFIEILVVVLMERETLMEMMEVDVF